MTSMLSVWHLLQFANQGNQIVPCCNIKRLIQSRRQLPQTVNQLDHPRFGEALGQPSVREPPD